jgi:hypothetical protein
MLVADVKPGTLPPKCGILQGMRQEEKIFNRCVHCFVE